MEESVVHLGLAFGVSSSQLCAERYAFMNRDRYTLSFFGEGAQFQFRSSS